MNAPQLPERLLWLDMEMTGLDVAKEVPIEVAAIITEWDFKPIEQYHAIVKQPQVFLDGMDEWNTKHHGQSGLTAKVANGTPPEQVDIELAELITRNFGGKPAILAGNSISQDRLFIKKYLPRTEALLHYRILDVTSWKVVFNGLYKKKFDKKDSHRALDDILESIAELKFYLTSVKP